jgi:hypothetical protein
MLEKIKQDLTALNGKDKLIVQQTNLVHVHAETGKGLAQHLHRRWPHCHPYDRKGVQPAMGSIQLISSQDHSPTICCLNAQRNIGHKQIQDDYEERLMAFANGLNQIKIAMQKEGELAMISAVYFPYKIGCGYGHGDWQKYYPLLLEFAKSILPLPTYLCHFP